MVQLILHRIIRHIKTDCSQQGGFEHWPSKHAQASVQHSLFLRHLHLVVEHDLHPQLTIATQFCGTGSMIVKTGFRCLPSKRLYQPQQETPTAGVLVEMISRQKSGNGPFEYVGQAYPGLKVFFSGSTRPETVGNATHLQMWYQSFQNTSCRQTFWHQLLFHLPELRLLNCLGVLDTSQKPFTLSFYRSP